MSTGRAAVAAAGAALVLVCAACGTQRHDAALHSVRAAARPVDLHRRVTRVATPRRSTHDCFDRPAACGYPAPSNTGAPATSHLRIYRGDLRITSPGQVVSGLDVRGTVEILASDVTFKDSRVTTTGATTSHSVYLGPGTSHVLIESSTFGGANRHSAAVQYAVQNAGAASNEAIALQMRNCTECWGGPGIVMNSWLDDNGVVAGAHDEAIYYGGGGGYLTVVHDTLLNPHGETADVFTKTDFGDIHAVTIAGNLMGGGGYMIYGGEGGQGRVLGPVTVTGNRFARCRSRRIAAGDGHICAHGADDHGYWSDGGFYGIAGDFNDAVTTWRGNYWDDNGHTVRNPD